MEFIKIYLSWHLLIATFATLSLWGALEYTIVPHYFGVVSIEQIYPIFGYTLSVSLSVHYLFLQKIKYLLLPIMITVSLIIVFYREPIVGGYHNTLYEVISLAVLQFFFVLYCFYIFYSIVIFC